MKLLLDRKAVEHQMQQIAVCVLSSDCRTSIRLSESNGKKNFVKFCSVSVNMVLSSSPLLSALHTAAHYTQLTLSAVGGPLFLLRPASLFTIWLSEALFAQPI